MNKLANIPNKIKQPSSCCIYCGKGYKTRTSLEKHVLLCEIIYKGKKGPLRVEEDDIPSQARLFQMLLELGHKYNRLEEKIEEMNKWVVQKKKKINVLDWLNANCNPELVFENLSELVIVNYSDIELLLNNSFNDTLSEIFSKCIYNQIDTKTIPIFAFTQKNNTFYIYDSLDSCKEWSILSKEKLVRFLNKIQMKISKSFQEWKKGRSQEIRENEVLSTLCDKALIKIMSAEFKQDIILNKIKNIMFSKMKTDMKSLVEFDF